MKKNKNDILILDEIICVIDFKLINEREFIENIINKKPKNLELILTGRNASQNLIELADLRYRKFKGVF